MGGGLNDFRLYDCCCSDGIYSLPRDYGYQVYQPRMLRAPRHCLLTTHIYMVEITGRALGYIYTFRALSSTGRK